MELDARGDAEGWISLSQFELAEMLAVSQPTIQRCLQRLASRGLVRLGYSRVQVADRGALECDRFGGDEVVPVG
jgi:DNA-binding transcriptional regulator LsrR (DeoR family)